MAAVPANPVVAALSAALVIAVAVGFPLVMVACASGSGRAEACGE